MPNFFKNFINSAKKTVRKPSRLGRKVGPFLAAAGGNYFLGPIGGLLAGTLHGAASSNSHNRLSGGLGGAGKALLYNELASLGANAFGVPTDSFLGKIAGTNHGSLLHQTGLMEGARDIGGGSGLFGGYGQPGVISQAMENGLGFKDSLFGNAAKSALGAGAKSFLNMATGGMQELPNQEDERYDGYPEYDYNQSGGQYSNNNNQDYDEDNNKNSTGYGNIFNKGNEYSKNYGKKNGYDIPSEILKSHNSDQNKEKSIHERYKDYIFKKEGRKETKEELLKKKKKKIRGYAAGGLVKGNNTSGIADDIDTFIPKGSYVANAMVTSLLGDGSTNYGARKLREFEAPHLRKNVHFKPVRALISNGEYVIRPATVDAIGKGNNDKGAKILENGFNKLLKQKGVKHILPPAAKPIASYMR